MATGLEKLIIGAKVSLELPFHEHALILRELSCSFCCQACSLEFHGGPTYCCEDCNFFLHKSCAESPSEIRHPSHPQHALRLHCSGDFRGRFVYRCDECGFIVSAASAIATLGDDEDEETIKHFAHDEHRLSCFSVTTPNKIDCKACGGSISGKVYGCRACMFLLHESCARLPLRIEQHVLHSLHRLDLVAHSGNLFECRACGFVRYDEFAYHCECGECNFSLDVECAISTLSLQSNEGNTIQHFTHQQHPLVSFQMEKESRNICCKVSGKNLSGEVYGCVDCIFFLLKSSAELPQKLQHFLHPLHTLNLRMISSGFVFRCESCNFHLDPESAIETLSAVENGANDRIRHFAHGYPMTLQFFKGLDGPSCGACKHKIFGLAYCCLIPEHPEHDFVLHKSCAELQLKLKHPSHPQHPLVLLPAAINGFFNCSACNRESKGFTFYCSECEFHLDIECSLQQPTRKHHLHEHKLTYYNKAERLRCDRCDNSCNTDLFRCVRCNFNLHHDCLPLPQYAETEKHCDILELRDEFISDDSNGYMYCDQCENLRHPKHGVYLCEEEICEFVAHITCMYPQVLAKIPEVIKEPKKSDEPDEETMNIDCNSNGEEIAALTAKIEAMKIKLEVLRRDRANMKFSFSEVHDQQEYGEGQAYKIPEVKALEGSDKIFSNLAHIEDESDDEDESVGMYSAASAETAESAMNETSPFLGGERVLAGQVIRGNNTASTYDLFEQMHFLYVRVVKARGLPAMDVKGNTDPFVEVKVGNYRGITKHFEKRQNPEWNQVFAFSREQIQASILDVVLKGNDLLKDVFVGIVRFGINEVPVRVTPDDSPLAPEWYRLEDQKGDKIKEELMLAVWVGTQADQAFLDATPIDSTADAATSTLIRSKVYLSPRLWYVRVNVVEAQDLVPTRKNGFPEFYVKGQIGLQIMRTQRVTAWTLNPNWKEELVFVAAEPFKDRLILTVQDCDAHGKDETIGKIIIPLNEVERRADNRVINSRWFNLEKPVAIDVVQLKKFSMRIHLQVCLEGGYHVFDESTHYSSDLRPTEKKLWKPSVGVLELGILQAVGLDPMTTLVGKSTSDTYCVAKYGNKWVRTRTIVDNRSPKFNEQYTWDVYDPATVITVGVFDNSQLGEKENNDTKIGKVRIRISTLEAARVYTHSYPLLVLYPTGVKKMGELHLAIRFTCTSLANMLYTYSQPLLPRMHYVQPLNVMQLDMLRHHAIAIVAVHLGRSELPLRREVVECMTDVESLLWSMRKGKANFFRLMAGYSGFLAVGRLLGDICMWKNPNRTVLVHVLYLVMLACFPKFILLIAFFYIFLIGLWTYRYRPRYPSHIDPRISHTEAVHPDELDEEFDTFPTSKNTDIVRMRYDRLRIVAGRIQTVVGDVATQGERIQALLYWRDPRATAIFISICLAVILVIYLMPLQVIAALAGFYMMRHPRFRHQFPSAPINFFHRLPSRIDNLF